MMLRLLLLVALLLRIAMPVGHAKTRSAASSLHAARASAVLASTAARPALRESTRSARGERLLFAALPPPHAVVLPASFVRVRAPACEDVREGDSEDVAPLARGPPRAA